MEQLNLAGGRKEKKGGKAAPADESIQQGKEHSARKQACKSEDANDCRPFPFCGVVPSVPLHPPRPSSINLEVSGLPQSCQGQADQDRGRAPTRASFDANIGSWAH